MKQIEFQIEGYDYTFRNKNLSPTQALALQTIVEFDNFDKSKHMYDKVFECIEVKIADTWQPLKEENVEVYMPVGIEENLLLLQNVAIAFISKVLQPLFQKSTELNKQQSLQQ